MLDCDNCGEPFNPTGSRWRCPRCGWKNTCCEGEPACSSIADHGQTTETDPEGPRNNL